MLRNDTKTKLINFVNASNDKQITLQIIIKESHKNKSIIIYSENILYDKSGIGLNIFTEDENNNNYIYNIGKNIYLISSEIKLKKSNCFLCIKFAKNIFITKYLKFDDIKNMIIPGFSLNFEGKKDIFSFELIIDKSVSNLFCGNDENNILLKINEKNENYITIYTIIPKYNIVNLTGNKNNESVNLLLKNSQKYFLGVNIQSLEEIKNKNNYYMFKNLYENYLYTICLKDNIYNIELKKSRSGGYKNIFVFNNNMKYSQVIVENKTNFEIFLKQKGFEKFKQKIMQNEQQILKIYEQSNNYFSVEIDNKLYYLNLNETGQKQLKKNLYQLFEKDKISTKIIFFIKSFNHNIFSKSKSLMNIIRPNFNNLKFNFSEDKYIKINFLINHINISIISQNKQERKEIVLLFINNFQCGAKLLTSKLYSRYKIKLNAKISNLETYNLLNNNNSYICLNSSSPLINIYSELNYEPKKILITVFELVNEFGDIKLNITPKFLEEIYNFVLNIYENTVLYKKKISNIFLAKNLDTDLLLLDLQNNYYYRSNPLNI